MPYQRSVRDSKTGKEYGLYWYKSIREGTKIHSVYLGKVSLDWHNSTSEQKRIISVSLKSLPFQDVKGLTDVYISSNLELGYSATFKHNEKGFSIYIAKETLQKNEIENDKEFVDLVNNVISHEIGHNVYDKLNSEQKSSWRSFFYEGNNKELMPSEYSQNSPMEGFSESYSRIKSNLPINEKVKIEMEKYLC
jgi:hypothetical protein